MKTLNSALLLLATAGMLHAEPVWQVHPWLPDIEALHETPSGVCAVTDEAEVLLTQDGVEWSLLQDLREGRNGYVKQVLRPAGGGLAVLDHLTHDEFAPAGGRLYTSGDGLHWTTQIEAGSGRLSDLWRVANGWIVHTVGASPAVVWQSTDGVHWNEVYRNESRVLDKFAVNSENRYFIFFEGGNLLRHITSTDSTHWTEPEIAPSHMIEMNGMYVGTRSASRSFALFFSEDGRSWETSGNFSSRPAQQLWAGDGIFVFADGYDSLYRSEDGRNWEAAAWPADVILPNGPMRIALGYDGTAFWYRLEQALHPTEPQGEAWQTVLTSPDGRSWTTAETLPDDFDSAAAYPEENPLFEPIRIPPPVSPSGGTSLPDAKQVSISGYTLKMQEHHQREAMALYLESGDAGFALVDLLFTLPLESMLGWNAVTVINTEQFVAVEEIASIDDSFVVLTESGDIALFDPAGDYLTQPRPLWNREKHDDHIEFSWPPVDGAQAYTVYRASSTGASVGDWTMVAETSSSAYADWDIETGVDRYAYRVQAKGEEAGSLMSLAFEADVWTLRNSLGPVQDGCGTGPTFDYQILPMGKGLALHVHPVSKTVYPWLYTTEHGWWYAMEEPGALWFHDQQFGWLFTRKSFYPWLYDIQDRNWLYFVGSDDNTRCFFDADADTYFWQSR